MRVEALGPQHDRNAFASGVTLAIQLAGQNCGINVYQQSTGLYFDLPPARRR